jgi:pimeloyl-ACP methyl ester carboxylesterase
MVFSKRIAPLLAGFALSASLFAASPAGAQTFWLAPAFPGEAPLGPEKAKGIVVWNHGRSIDSEDSEAPTPPYMHALEAAGWDVFRFNRMRVGDTLSKSADALADEVHQLKAQGYHEVALTGQSFGGFLALMAADRSDDVDAVIVTAPAAYGSFSDFYDSWRNNATQLYPLLERVRHARIMAFYFHGDDFDPGGRGDRSREILDGRHIANIVVDQPAQLTTHWAATTPLFEKKFGGCILGFLEAPQIASDASCDNDALVAGGPDATAPRHPAAKQGGAARTKAAP